MGFSFAAPVARRSKAEPVVPMINVVFLLLIFFLMSAQIAPSPPFGVEPAASASDTRTDAREATLWISAEGALAYGDARDEAVWSALASARPDRLAIRADKDLAATTLARALKRVGALGIADVVLHTRPRRSP